MENTLYHKMLRIAMLVLAVMLVFDSGALLPVTKQLSDETGQYLGQAVGMYASVETTELSTITAELTKKEQELAERELALNEREINVGLNTNTTESTGGDRSTLVMSILLFIILVLIVFNYILDFWRARQYLQTYKI